MDDQITAPVQKAATALGAGAGSSVTAMAANAGGFLPSDLAGWLAVAASAAALFYTICLLSEWWYKKVWKPVLIRLGWMRG